MELFQNQIELLDGFIEQTLDYLYNNDLYLIQNRVNERTIVGRFAIYFQQLLTCSEMRYFHLDVEYNKNHSNPKQTVNFPNGTYPDLILHKRGSNDNNICIFEFKTWWNSNTSDDIEKLKDFTRQDYDYKYGAGFSLVLNKKRQTVQKYVVKNGEVLND